MTLKITAYPQQKELANVTLVNDQAFDFAVESGVDGQGLNERTYTRGLGSGSNTSSQKGRAAKTAPS